MKPEFWVISLLRVEKNRKSPPISLDKADLSITWFSFKVHETFLRRDDFDLTKTLCNFSILALLYEKL